MEDLWLLPLDVHTFDHDALILEDSQVKEVTLYDTKRRPCLRLCFDAPLVGLWSPPGKNAPFVCIEPWHGTAATDGKIDDFSDKKEFVYLEPGKEYGVSFDITVSE